MLQTHLIPKELEMGRVDVRVRRRAVFIQLLHCPRPTVTAQGNNFPTDSSPKQNILPNATGHVLVSVNTVISFPPF